MGQDELDLVEIKNNMYSDDTDISSVEDLKTRIDVIKDNIKTFFSSDYTGKHIRDVYDILSDYTQFEQGHLRIVDIDEIVDTYDEYHEGLREYINKVSSNVNSINDNGDTDNICNQISDYIHRDNSFIDDLFGKNCEFTDCRYDEAMSEIERLIDVIENTNDALSFGFKITAKTNDISPQLCNMLMKLYGGSYTLFTSNLVNTIFDTFSMLYDRLNSGSSYQKPSQPTKPMVML